MYQILIVFINTKVVTLYILILGFRRIISRENNLPFPKFRLENTNMKSGLKSY